MSERLGGKEGKESPKNLISTKLELGLRDVGRYLNAAANLSGVTVEVSGEAGEVYQLDGQLPRVVQPGRVLVGIEGSDRAVSRLIQAVIYQKIPVPSQNLRRWPR